MEYTIQHKIQQIIFGGQHRSKNSSLCNLPTTLLSHPAWVKLFSLVPYPRTPSTCFSRNVRDQVSHPQKTTYLSALLIRQLVCVSHSILHYRSFAALSNYQIYTAKANVMTFQNQDKKCLY